MLKFIRGKGHQPSAERQKLLKELFTCIKTIQHGFPSKPSALAWDPQLQLLAIGTKGGAVKIFGAPGVEFYGEHQNSEPSVRQLLFVPSQGRLISLCEDNSLHLWEVNTKGNRSILEEVKSHSLEGKLKSITALCVDTDGEHLLVGTEGGNIYLMNIKTFDMTDTIIYQDVVMQNVPESYKVNPGAVESIYIHPTHKEKVLVGYVRGLLVLWDRKTLNAEQTFTCQQQLEGVCWHPSGNKFISSHNDGSYNIWSTEASVNVLLDSTTPYGPFPCKAINKIQWGTHASNDYIIFSGGMPRASFADRHTVTVMRGDKHVVFDFTSKVVDFALITQPNNKTEGGVALLVLAEEELVGVDLESETWQPLCLPYLVSPHSSAVTCAQHVSGVTNQLWADIVAAGEKQTEGNFSQRPWPVTGGSNLFVPPNSVDRNLLLTGHEDGTVGFWDASSVSMHPLYKFSASQLFTGEEGADVDGDEGDDEEWPPFKKVGTFDPYSDDPRLAVKRVLLCPLSGTLVVAGTAGQVVVAQIKQEPVEKEIKLCSIDIVSDRDSFVWKGHEQLSASTGSLKHPAGFQASCIVQLHPPAAVVALALHSEWGLLAAGTAHGMGLFDYIRGKTVATKCTLNPNDLSGAGDYAMSRRKSFKKSLRESFRRLRKGRSQRNVEKRAANKEVKKEEVSHVTESSPSPNTPIESRPVERQIEARPTDDGFGSMVRCLYLNKSFIASVQVMTATLWVGTNNGTVLAFALTVPSSDNRQAEDVGCILAKEIQLKHRAPVLAIGVVDGIGIPLPEPMEEMKGVAKVPDVSAHHRVVICSEEQIKVFTLPNLKPYCKFKLTAHEGSRVRKVQMVAFPTRSGGHLEHCLCSLTNQGDVLILSVPDLRKQQIVHCIRREDINGISSLVFSRQGEAFYLHSSSEFQRLTLSAANIVAPNCHLVLPEGSRTKETVPPPPPPAVNGIDDSVSEGEKVVTPVEEKKVENSLLEAEEIKHDTSADITIDSVKDHLTNNSNMEERMITTETVKKEHFEVNSKVESLTVVSKTTTSENTIINNTTVTAEN